MFAFLEEAGRYPCEEYNRNLQSILGSYLSFSPCGCDKKYPDQINLKEKEITWLTISDYIPLLQGSQDHRSLKQLGISHLQWRAEWSKFVFLLLHSPGPQAQGMVLPTVGEFLYTNWCD